jgi:hemoglobin
MREDVMEPMIDRIGGEEKVHHLVDHFYDLIETLPQGRAIMEMHLKGHGLSHVRPAQFELSVRVLRRAALLSRTPRPHEPAGNPRACGNPHPGCRRLAGGDGPAMTETGVAEPEKSQIMTTLSRAALMLVNIAD